ncbi:MAG TPA: ATP-binding protein, partial [Chitinophagaceae bacterium]|nr:ATP-binding protein [Chitinophagaceae bacterium]
TNSIKYAFPDNMEGVISISLDHISAEQLLLTIKDNGQGLPAAFDIHTKDSMGMNLMQGLSEDIGGRFTICNQNGTVVGITFNYDPVLIPNLTVTNKETYSI